MSPPKSPFHSSSPGSTTYRAYLIRLWRDGEGGTWRASAQSVDGQIIVRFASLEALHAFLRSQTEASESNSQSSLSL
ncbi:MAG: hypothetical protein KDE54_00425 [Caldilineaceae bacterium]|nr:hypothetical protein [Caldilineaceae bacterium]MCB0139580.1 hypothetical protein [Caldilineaceae bacterium]